MPDFVVTNAVDGVPPPPGLERRATYCHDCGRPVYWTVRAGSGESLEAVLGDRNRGKSIVCGGCGAARWSVWKARERGVL